MIYDGSLKDSAINFVDNKLPMGLKLSTFSRLLSVSDPQQSEPKGPGEITVRSTTTTTTSKIPNGNASQKRGLATGCVSRKVIESRRNHLKDLALSSSELTSDTDNGYNTTQAGSDEEEEEEEEQSSNNTTIEITLPGTKTSVSDLIDLNEVMRNLKLLNLSINNELIYSNDTNLKNYVSKSMVGLLCSIRDSNLLMHTFESLDDQTKLDILKLYLGDCAIVDKFKAGEEHEQLLDMDDDDEEDGDYSSSAENIQEKDGLGLERFMASQLLTSTPMNSKSSSPTPRRRGTVAKYKPTGTRENLSKMDELLIQSIDLVLMMMRLIFNRLILPITLLFFSELAMLNENYQIVNNVIKLFLDLVLLVLSRLMGLLSITNEETSDTKSRKTRSRHSNNNDKGGPSSGLIDVNYLTVAVMRKMMEAFNPPTGSQTM
ncbi:hypothetical protein CANARDRAFT_28168 [[Candida] arabinofermentans NRRL YB-2248]|uniref:Uncharacterized protein n=1 Tax=[Candida] arabinofermentans NRRL YB-2248 TaxID=983967 RepID=A0A1E4T0Y9_9ASCO|nr:hypothetical protein CANARDRAFT_28168 [[Candida] arabinofermentans NRRL YB-2248]